MRILTVILFLMIAVVRCLFAAGTVIFSENGDNFPAGWTLYHDNGAADFGKANDSAGNYCWRSFGALDLYSYAEVNLNIHDYDEAIFTIKHFKMASFAIFLQYYDGTWNNIADLSAFVSGLLLNTYGPYSIPVTASHFRIKSCLKNNSLTPVSMFDDLIITADKRPTLAPSGKAGYANDGVEPNVAKTVEPFIFQIKYTDGDNDAPSYMRLHILNEGVEISGSPFSMNYVEGSYAAGALYSKELKFSTGTYTYYFDTSDGWLSCTNAADQKRFDVINVDPPPLPVNVSPKASDGATVTSNIVELAWSPSATDPYGVSYTVLVSTGTDSYFAPSRTPSVLKAVYTGPATSHTLTNLLPGTQYNWQVEAINGMGIKTTSPLYSFMTLAKPASIFNYPNPFNPVRQQTTIVYDVDTAQDVKIKIYSEYGSLVFEDTHSALPGSNEYRYDGKDNTGKTLYNGSYICRIESSKGTSTCYLLIVK